MRARERQVRLVATQLLDQLDIGAPPIDPIAIAEAKRLALEDVDLPDTVYGALVKDGNRFVIYVSRSCPTSGHRNFTVAHELGHYHIPGHIDVLFAGGREIALSEGGHFRDYENREEREADWFASELLAPRRMVLPRIRHLPASIDTLLSLAEEFATSITMMALRYTELTDEAVATVLSYQEQAEWVICSKRIREHGWSRSLQRRDFVPAHTATRGLAGDEEAIRRTEQRTSSNLMCEWFEGAPEELEVGEDAMGLGRFGRVLTFLVVPELPDPDDLAERGKDAGERDWRDALRGYRLD